MASTTARVTAVHEEHTLQVLQRLGVAETYRSGALKCSVCGTPLREAGLGAAKRVAGDVVFACVRLDCLEEFHAG